MWVRFSAPVQTVPGAHPASCTMGTGSFPGIKSGRGVTQTPHPLLVPWSWKCRAIPLLFLWAVRPAQSLSACTSVHYIFTFHVFERYVLFVHSIYILFAISAFSAQLVHKSTACMVIVYFVLLAPQICVLHLLQIAPWHRHSNELYVPMRHPSKAMSSVEMGECLPTKCANRCA